MFEEGELKFIGVVEDAGGLSKVKIFPEFCAGLQRLNDFSHIIVLYWFHLRDKENERRTLRVVPRRHPGAPQVGVFACRSPSRPNPIGRVIGPTLVRELPGVRMPGSVRRVSLWQGIASSPWEVAKSRMKKSFGASIPKMATSSGTLVTSRSSTRDSLRVVRLQRRRS